MVATNLAPPPRDNQENPPQGGNVTYANIFMFEKDAHVQTHV
jgi:hypothetical protein